MTIDQAANLIHKGIAPSSFLWADLGAGTGIFTLALKEILPEARILSLDKNPHALYNLQRAHPWLEIIEGDFTQALDLPPLDGILMANALHYVSDPEVILPSILSFLKPGGCFILIEYDTDRPVKTWVPFPISYQRFVGLAVECKLEEPRLIGTRPSLYGRGKIYAALATKA